MTSIADSTVTIQTSSQSVPSTPAWFGEITLMTHHLQRQGVLAAIERQVHFARRRGLSVRSDRFSRRALRLCREFRTDAGSLLRAAPAPFGNAFMALFGRDRQPARSTLSRFLASLDQAAVEALRTLFLHELLARPLVKEEQPGGLWDRQGNHFLVFDIDGTREAARQRALPKTADRPAPQRRLRPLCAPGYTGRKRGEVVRTRSTVWAAPIRISGLPRWEIPAMASTGESCVGQ